MNRPSRIYATIDLDAVTWNLENMRKNISKDTKIIAVLKADAYGHGAVPIALIIVGPLGNLLNDLVQSGANYLNAHVSWLIPMLMGAFQPFLTLTGTAWAMTPIATSQISTLGYEIVNGPGMLASNIAQGGATLAVALKAKDENLKSLASSSGFTAVMGITEPCLYGVLLKLKRPFVASMIGGAAGGIYAGITGLVRYAFVPPGLTAIPAFIGKNPMNVVHAIVTIIISFVVGFVASWILGFKEDEPQEEAISTAVSKDEVYAPCDGTITVCFPTGHAIGLKSKNGTEILMHVGIDTVNLQGKYFDPQIKVNEEVKKGQLLLTFDLDKIKEAGYDTTTPVIITGIFEIINCQPQRINIKIIIFRKRFNTIYLLAFYSYYKAAGFYIFIVTISCYGENHFSRSLSKQRYFGIPTLIFSTQYRKNTIIRGSNRKSYIS